LRIELPPALAGGTGGTLSLKALQKERSHLKNAKECLQAFFYRNYSC